MSANKVDPTQPITTNETRDSRFKDMLQQQFGENGIPLLVNQAFLFLLALIMVVVILLGLVSLKSEDGGTLQLTVPALVLESNLKK